MQPTTVRSTHYKDNVKIFRKQSQGFSIVEMLVSTVAILLLSLVSYRVLKSQTDRQMESVMGQKNSSSSQVALTRFEKDFKRVSYDWAKSGIAAIYPHQGYGMGGNYYVDANIRSTEELNDGVTFLTRNSSSDRFYSVVSNIKRLCYPAAVIQAEDQALLNSSIMLDTSNGINVGDWVLLSQAGNYALAVVATKASSSGGVDPANPTSRSGAEQENEVAITLRAPNAIERQSTTLNVSGRSNGFVKKHGVVAASFDFDGTATTSATDDSFCFDRSKMNFQKIGSPVSYYVDYRTSDGMKKSSGNSYKLDEKGNKVRMLVRSEYKNGAEVREYITPVEEVGFTYDILNESDSISFSGTDNVSVIRDVGRTQGSDNLLNISANPNSADSNFQSSYRIVAVKMKVGYQSKDQNQPGQFITQFQDLKVALDPSLREQMYQDKTRVLSSLTQDLKTGSGSGATNEQVGKPLYLVHGDSREVMVPVSTFEIMEDGSMGATSNGVVYIYDEQGCAVNGSSCSPSAQSAIQFNIGTGKFFPNTISQIELENGTRRIIIGGAAMWSSSGSTKRIPGFGIITLAAGETLKDKLTDATDGGTCNISNCSWQSIDNTSGDMTDLMDTAVLSVDPKADKIYIASLTKKLGEASPGIIYRGNWTGSSYSVEKMAQIPRTEEGKLITALSDKPVRIYDQEYLAVCLSKQMSSSCSGDCIKTSLAAQSVGATQVLDGSGNHNNNFVVEDNGDAIGQPSSEGASTVSPYGEIQLISTSTGQTVKIMKHNYKCSSINVDSNGNLIIGGRLTISTVSNTKLKRAIVDTSYRNQLAQEILYLDEVAHVENGINHYADYYRVDPETYSNNGPLWVGWGTGNSAVEFDDGTFGIVYGNKYRLGPGYLSNGSGSIKEFSNAGISQVKLAGMSDRVVATIETDPSNINNSIITATYYGQQSEIPDLFIPGQFYIDPSSNRTDPTPLPAMPPSMNEKSWLQLYQSFYSPRGASSLNSNMPTLTDSYTAATSCQGTLPKSCH